MNKFRLFRKNQEFKTFLYITISLGVLFYIFMFFFKKIDFDSKRKNVLYLMNDSKYKEALNLVDDYYGLYSNDFTDELLNLTAEVYFNMYESSLKNKTDMSLDVIVDFFQTVHYLKNNNIGDKDLVNYYLYIAYVLMGGDFYENFKNLFFENKDNSYFDSVEVQKYLFSVFLEKKDYELALNIINILLKKEPNNLFFQLQNATIFYEQGDFFKSLDALKAMVFGSAGYDVNIRKAVDMLIKISMDFSLFDKVNYYYIYILDRSGRDPYWVSEYDLFEMEEKKRGGM